MFAEISQIINTVYCSYGFQIYFVYRSILFFFFFFYLKEMGVFYFFHSFLLFMSNLKQTKQACLKCLNHASVQLPTVKWGTSSHTQHLIFLHFIWFFLKLNFLIWVPWSPEDGQQWMNDFFVFPFFFLWSVCTKISQIGVIQRHRPACTSVAVATCSGVIRLSNMCLSQGSVFSYVFALVCRAASGLKVQHLSAPQNGFVFDFWFFVFPLSFVVIVLWSLTFGRSGLGKCADRR